MQSRSLSESNQPIYVNDSSIPSSRDARYLPVQKMDPQQLYEWQCKQDSFQRDAQMINYGESNHQPIKVESSIEYEQESSNQQIPRKPPTGYTDLTDRMLRPQSSFARQYQQQSKSSIDNTLSLSNRDIDQYAREQPLLSQKNFENHIYSQIGKDPFTPSRNNSPSQRSSDATRPRVSDDQVISQFNIRASQRENHFQDTFQIPGSRQQSVRTSESYKGVFQNQSSPQKTRQQMGSYNLSPRTRPYSELVTRNGSPNQQKHQDEHHSYQFFKEQAEQYRNKYNDVNQEKTKMEQKYKQTICELEYQLKKCQRTIENMKQEQQRSIENIKQEQQNAFEQAHTNTKKKVDNMELYIIQKDEEVRRFADIKKALEGAIDNRDKEITELQSKFDSVKEANEELNNQIEKLMQEKKEIVRKETLMKKESQQKLIDELEQYEYQNVKNEQIMEDLRKKKEKEMETLQEISTNVKKEALGEFNRKYDNMSKNYQKQIQLYEEIIQKNEVEMNVQNTEIGHSMNSRLELERQVSDAGRKFKVYQAEISHLKQDKRQIQSKSKKMEDLALGKFRKTPKPPTNQVLKIIDASGNYLPMPRSSKITSNGKSMRRMQSENRLQMADSEQNSAPKKRTMTGQRSSQDLRQLMYI